MNSAFDPTRVFDGKNRVPTGSNQSNHQIWFFSSFILIRGKTQNTGWTGWNRLGT